MQWGEVSCEDRNGEIAGYIVEYSSANMFIPHTGAITVSGADNRTAVVGGLLPSTMYTISVRAQGASTSAAISSTNCSTAHPTGQRHAHMTIKSVKYQHYGNIVT